jgi:BNR repeat-like domain/Concanavalin A-like lectin/glucanases superfamily
MFKSGHANQPMAPVVASGDVDAPNAAFSSGASGYVRRIPLSVIAPNGDLLLFYEMRPGPQDYQSSAIGLSRSTDNGQTWGASKLVYVRSDYASNSKWVSLGVAVVNRNGRVILHFVKSDGASGSQVMTLGQYFSDDNGLTWGGTTAGDATPREITTGLKKVNNATPASLPACFDRADAAWGWCMPGPGRGICLSSGRLIIPYNHRYSLDQTGPSTCHVAISDDHGATWFLGGGFAEASTSNDGTNEIAIGLLQNGDFYVNCRIVSGGNGNKRGQVVIAAANIGTSWPNYSVMTDGTNQIDSSSTAGSVVVAADGSVLVCCPSDDTIRGRLAVFRSTNGGTSFPVNNVINYGYSGYSSLFESSAGNFGCLFEATDDYANEGQTDNRASSQNIRLVRFDLGFLSTPDVAVADWHLNDGVAGKATEVTGTQIGVFRGYCAPGKGGANARWHADGLEFLGSGAGVQLQEAQAAKFGGICDPGLSNMTYEGEFKISSTLGVDATLFDSNNASATLKGVSAVIQTADGKIRFRVNDGVNSCTKVSTAAYNDNAWHRIAITYQRGTGLSLFFDGVKDGSTQADNLTSTTAIAGGQAFRLGSRGGGASPLLANSFCRRFRVTRKVLAIAEMLPAAAPKVSTNVQSGFNAQPTAGLPSQSALRLALFLPQTGRADGYGSSDHWGGITWPARPPRDGGTCNAYRDSALDVVFRTSSAYRSGRWETDTKFGRHFRPSVGSSQSSTAAFTRSALSTDYDFIQNTAVGSILLAVNFIADSFGAGQFIVDNAQGSPTSPGVMIYRNTSTNLISLQIARGTALSRTNETYGAALTNDTWYFLAWTFNGTGVKVNHYRAQYSGGVLGAIASSQSANNIDAVDGTSNGTYNSAYALAVGSRTDDLRGCNCRIGPLLFFNTPLSAPEVAAWAAVMNKGPIIPAAGGRGRNRGRAGLRRLSRHLLGR